MTITATPVPGASLISPADHTLVLIDFQSQMAFATKSIAPELLRSNAALVSHAAKSFDVPTILTTWPRKASLARCLTRSRTRSRASRCLIERR